MLQNSETPPPRIAGMSPPTSSVSSNTQPAPDLWKGQLEILGEIIVEKHWNLFLPPHTTPGPWAASVGSPSRIRPEVLEIKRDHPPVHHPLPLWFHFTQFETYFLCSFTTCGIFLYSHLLCTTFGLQPCINFKDIMDILKELHTFGNYLQTFFETQIP